MRDMSGFRQVLEAMGRPQVYADRGVTAPKDDASFLQGFKFGNDLRRQWTGDAERERNASDYVARLEKLLSDPYGQGGEGTPQPQQPQGIPYGYVPSGEGIGVSADQPVAPQTNKYDFSEMNFQFGQPQQKPQGFGQAFQAVENTVPKTQNMKSVMDGGQFMPQDFNKFRGFNGIGVNANPTIPASDNEPTVGGTSPNYLDDKYGMAQWLAADRERGVDNPLISMMRYSMFIEPLRQAAKEDELRKAFYTLNSPNASDQDRMNAMSMIEYSKGNPFMDEDRQMRMQDLQSRIVDRNFRNLGDYAGMNLEGKSWVRNNDGVDLSNAQPHTIAGLNHISDIFKQMTGKQLIVTSGNDGDMHAGGEFSHGNGWKVDVSGNGLEDPEVRHAFIQQCQNLGIDVLDEYENPSPNSTGGHLDLSFSGYRGNVKGQRRYSSRQYPQKTTPYGDTKLKEMTEKEFGGIKTAVTKLNEDNSPESAQALIDGLKNEYGRILYTQKTPENAINKLYDDLVGGRFGKLNQNEDQIKNIVASVYASVAGGMDERERKKNEEIAMKYLSGGGQKNNDEKPTQTSPTGQKPKSLSEVATSNNRNDLDERRQAGALRELDEIHDNPQYARPTISSLGEVANFVKGGGKIGDDKLGDELVAMIENAGRSQVTPKRRSR